MPAFEFISRRLAERTRQTELRSEETILSTEMKNDEQNNGPMKDIVVGLQSIMSRPEFVDLFRWASQSEDYRIIGETQFRSGLVDFALLFKVRRSKFHNNMPEVVIAIKALDTKVMQNRNIFRDQMETHEICFRKFDFYNTLKSSASKKDSSTIRVRSTVGTHQQFSQQGFSKALVLSSHLVIRQVAELLASERPIRSCIAEIIDGAKNSDGMGGKQRLGWSSAMARRLGYSFTGTNPQSKSNLFEYVYTLNPQPNTESHSFRTDKSRPTN